MIRRSILLAALLAAAAGAPAQSRPDPGRNAPPFGAQVVWPNQPKVEQVLDRMQESGARWARFDLAWWNDVERSRGSYNFNPGTWNTDRMVTMLEQRGLIPYCILGYGNTLYDTVNGNFVGPFTGAGRDAFANYAAAAATRYRGRVTYWEIWNEPNLAEFWGPNVSAADYAALVAVTAPRIRAANPAAVIVGGATSEIPLNYLRTAFDNGLLDHIDVLSIHPYRWTSPESANSEYAELRAIMAGYTTRRIPIWSGEWGYSVHAFNLDEQAQAKLATRMLVNNLAQGLDLSIWFSMHPWSTNPADGPNPEWGMIYLDHTPRPSFNALRNLVTMMPAPVRRIDDPFQTTLSGANSTIRRAWFEHADTANRTIALWVARWPATGTSTPLTRNITLQLPESLVASVHDPLSGAEVPATQTRNGGALTINSVPIPDYPLLVRVGPRPGTIAATEPTATFPNSMLPGQLRLVTATFRNAGTATWDSKLELAAPADGSVVGRLQNAPVAPGELGEFRLVLQAPRDAAVLTRELRLRADGTWLADEPGHRLVYTVPIVGSTGLVHVEAELYDTQGRGVSFMDSDLGNNGDNSEWRGGLRQDDVDLAESGEGDLMVGWMAPGEWLRYSALPAQPGVYTVEMRVAALTAGARSRLVVNGAPIGGSIAIPATGGWRTFSTIDAGTVTLGENNDLRVLIDTDGWNLSWIRFRRAEPDPDGDNLLVY